MIYENFTQQLNRRILKENSYNSVLKLWIKCPF